MSSVYLTDLLCPQKPPETQINLSWLCPNPEGSWEATTLSEMSPCLWILNHMRSYVLLLVTFIVFYCWFALYYSSWSKLLYIQSWVDNLFPGFFMESEYCVLQLHWCRNVNDVGIPEAQTHLADKQTGRSRASSCVYLHCCVDGACAVTAFSAQAGRKTTHILQPGADVRQKGAQRPPLVASRTALYLLQADAA